MLIVQKRRDARKNKFPNRDLLREIDLLLCLERNEFCCNSACSIQRAERPSFEEEIWRKSSRVCSAPRNRRRWFYSFELQQPLSIAVPELVAPVYHDGLRPRSFLPSHYMHVIVIVGTESSRFIRRMSLPVRLVVSSFQCLGTAPRTLNPSFNDGGMFTWTPSNMLISFVGLGSNFFPSRFVDLCSSLGF